MTTIQYTCFVKDTNVAEEIFDIVAYTKGACAIRQLYLIVGHKNFSEALKIYFEKYAWNNITHEEFLETFEIFLPKEFDYSISDWESDWLDSKGMSKISVEWDEGSRKKDSLIKLIQSSEEFPDASKKMFFKVAFLSDKMKILEIKEVITERDTTFITYDGSLEPKIVFLNYENEGYCNLEFDYFSLNYAILFFSL